MIKTILHLFKIHRKMIFGNPSIIVHDMLGITPKSLNAIDVIMAAMSKGAAVIKAMMFAPTFKRVVAPKSISLIHRSLTSMLLDMGHQLIGRHALNDLGVYPAITLQKPKYNAFTRRPSSTLAFAAAAKVGFVNFNLALKLARFKFSHMIDCFSQTMIHSGYRLIVKANINGQTIGGLKLIEAGDNGDLLSQLLKRFLFLTVGAFYISTPCPVNFERTAENTLSTSQKVGRTVENVLLTSNHKGILTPRGYECH